MRPATNPLAEPDRNSVTVGRYLLHRQIARGGMATIHIARLMGDEGFNRIVAAKRLLPEFAEDTEFVSMFMDEARIASKVHHPNVVPVLDLVTTVEDVMLVQEYVHGVPLHVLLRTAHEKNQRIPVRIAVAIAAEVLAGLQAAHTTLDEMGAPLNIIHRDVSPQNIMIAVDGSARLLDFGVAKATMAAHITRDNTFKGKLAYSSPEQVRGRPVQQTDIYALAVVLWELLVGHRMHGKSKGEAELVATIMGGKIPKVTEALENESDWGTVDSDEWKLLLEVEPIVQRGLAVDLAKRWQTATEMEEELTKAVTPASSSEVATWVKGLGKDFIVGRDKLIAAEEASWRRTHGGLTQLGHRRTPLPGERRRPSSQQLITEPPPSLRNGRSMLAIVGLLVLLLGVGAVFAMRRSSSESLAAPTATSPVAAPTPPTPAPPVAAAPAEPAPAEPTPIPSEVEPAAAAPTAAEASAPADQPTATREAPPVRRAPVRPAPRASMVKPVVKAPPAAAPVPKEKEAAPEPKATADCNPPYYFEGQKKVFKTNCL